MKTLPLSREYTHMSRLSKKDAQLFRKLLKRPKRDKKKNKTVKTVDDLFIMPVTLGCELTCCGFYIENYRLFRYQRDDNSPAQYYLVFYPVKYRRPPFTKKYQYFHYIIAKSHNQDNYYYLMRHNVFDTYQLAEGYTLIKHT